MTLDLVPEEKPPQHPERIDAGYLDQGITQLLDVMEAIDCPGDSRTTLKSWLQGKRERGELIDPEPLSLKIDALQRALKDVHESLAQARKHANGSKA